MKAKQTDEFESVFTTPPPPSEFSSDNFFSAADPGAFVPYMNLALNKDGTEQQPDSMKAKQTGEFESVFTTPPPPSEFSADNFFSNADPGAFFPYMNLKGSTAIVTTPEKALALIQMNDRLFDPIRIKGAYLI